MSSKTVYGNFIYISLVAVLVFVVLLPLSLYFKNDLHVDAIHAAAVSDFLAVPPF